MNETKQALEAVVALVHEVSDGDYLSRLANGQIIASKCATFVLYHGPQLAQALEDARRLDALERDVAIDGPLILHNGEGISPRRGLGLSNTNRTLRQAIDALTGDEA
ncbi:MAG: hypothetical protein R3212_05635 [Xanthomonadales bacterium]|nr:hypothetical protein [Xanthomonadales bacterium]